VVPLSINIGPKLSAYHDRTLRPGCNGQTTRPTRTQPELSPIAG
jgi:hypothetical protein